MRKKIGLNNTLFTPNVMYRDNGLFVGFLYNMQYIRVSAPKGYSTERVSELLEKYKKEAEEYNAAIDDSKELPNIVVVINETFSDLSVLGDFKTNVDYMPFVRSMSENTVKGYMYASIVGGNTPNSEFEFLSGCSLAFLPMGSVPFQQYITGALPSLVENVEKEGYSTYAMHPYGASGWDRDEVYPWLGFDSIEFQDKFRGAERIRDYVTDEALYERVIKYLNQKSPEEKLFCYVMTMQNHGGYYKDFDNFKVDVVIDGSTKKSTRRYLSLIKISDGQFKDLITYFENSFDEPVVVMMFGDHQPNNDIVEPVQTLNGLDASDLSLEDAQNRYKVPFVIWANYDIEEADYSSGISLNYLSNLLCSTAGLKITPYQAFLKDLYKEVPIVTANVVIDNKGDYYPVADNPYNDVLNDYACIQYNYLFDTKNRIDEFFLIPE
ncbi:MAG: LTA synthase family protein [Lachnospiraceae bacterium]|nr:LTA synthase family protein [Lachnospiraceae bacterium]